MKVTLTIMGLILMGFLGGFKVKALKTFTIRIRYADYLYIKKIIKPESEDESFLHWFYRVRQYIERIQNE